MDSPVIPPRADSRSFAVFRRNPCYSFVYETQTLATAAARELRGLGYDAEVMLGGVVGPERWEVTAKGTPDECSTHDAGPAFQRWADSTPGGEYCGLELPPTPTRIICVAGSIFACGLAEHFANLPLVDVLGEGLAAVVGTLVGLRIADAIEPATASTAQRLSAAAVSRRTS